MDRRTLALGAAVAMPLLMVMMSGMMFMPMAGSTSSTGAAVTAACADTSGSGGSSGGASVDADGSNASDVVDRLSNGTGVDLKGLEFDRKMIAGILGNATIESGVRYRTTYGHAQDDADNEQARAFALRPGAIGFVQWYKERGTALVDLAESRHANWYDPEIQIQYLINELSSNRSAAYKAMQEADGAREAARQFHELFEVSGDANIEPRLKAAEEWYGKIKGGTVDGAGAGGKEDTGSTGLAACGSNDTGGGGGGAEYGSVGGAPDVTVGDFSWMCGTDAHVCKNGDFGPFNTFSDYQCYWYALTRLWLIHDHDVANWHTACGGDVAGNLAHTPGWTVSSSPKPGDGVSQMGGALGGDTSCGHIAVVEEVVKDGSGWKIRISEGNYANGGTGTWTNGYGSRWLTSGQFAGAGNVFFRKDTWK